VRTLRQRRLALGCRATGSRSAVTGRQYCASCAATHRESTHTSATQSAGVAAPQLSCAWELPGREVVSTFLTEQRVGKVLLAAVRTGERRRGGRRRFGSNVSEEVGARSASIADVSGHRSSAAPIPRASPPIRSRSARRPPHWTLTPNRRRPPRRPPCVRTAARENLADALFCEKCATTSRPGSSHGAHDSCGRATPADWVAEVWSIPTGSLRKKQQVPARPVDRRPDPLPGSRALIGRSSKSRNVSPQIDCAADGSVSHRQPSSALDHDRWFVEDLGSTNGTFIGNAGDALPTTPIPPHERRELAMASASTSAPGAGSCCVAPPTTKRAPRRVRETTSRRSRIVAVQFHGLTGGSEAALCSDRVSSERGYFPPGINRAEEGRRNPDWVSRFRPLARYSRYGQHSVRTSTADHHTVVQSTRPQRRAKVARDGPPGT